MLLSFNVQKQIITRTDSESVVCNSMNFLYAQFTFSEEWTGTKTAVFKGKEKTYNALLDENDTCLVPWEVLTESWFYVSVFCGDLVTANKVTIYTIPSGYEIGDESRVPTPEIYIQVIEKLNEIESEVDPEAIQRTVDEYLADKDFVTEDDVETIVSQYVSEHVHGLAPGGTTGQVLIKSSDADYETEWENPNKITGKYNVLDFGLVGDGTTDNTTALRNMLSAVPNGSTVYFPRGTYNISGAITFSKNMNFVGDSNAQRTTGGKDSIINYVGNTENISLFSRNNYCDLSFKGLSFKGNAFQVIDNPNPVTPPPYPMLAEVETLAGVSCLVLGPDKNGQNDITNCAFDGFSGCAVVTSQNKFIRECSFANCKLGLTVTFDGMVQNCWFNKCGVAIEIVADSTHAAGSVDISDCWADALSQHFLTSSCSNVENLIMSNCWVGMVDKSAIYLTGNLGKSHIQATFDRIAMMYAGMEDSARDPSIAMETDCIYANAIRHSVFDITLGLDAIKRNNVEYPCVSRYLFSATPYGMSDLIFISPTITADKIYDKSVNTIYRLQAICRDGNVMINDKAQFVEGIAYRDSSPVGVSGFRAPAVGYLCIDSTNNKLYFSNGTTTQDWVALN